MKRERDAIFSDLFPGPFSCQRKISEKRAVVSSLTGEPLWSTTGGSTVGDKRRENKDEEKRSHPKNRRALRRVRPRVSQSLSI